MLVGVAPLPSSHIPTLWNIGILLHKQAKLRKAMQHRVVYMDLFVVVRTTMKN